MDAFRSRLSTLTVSTWLRRERGASMRAGEGARPVPSRPPAAHRWHAETGFASRRPLAEL
jgi:hypothetical protein